jgi:hypothetical protein
VLLGAGMDATTLFFSKSFQDLYGNKKNSAGQSQWAFSPGLRGGSCGLWLLDPVHLRTARIDAVISQMHAL